MTNLFDRFAPRCDAAVERLRGEVLRIEPMTGGRLSDAIADPDRTVLDGVTGVVSVEPGTSALFEGRRSGTAKLGNTRFAGADLTLWLSPAAVAALPWVLVRGDIVVRSSRPGMPRLMISDPPVGDLRGGITVALVRAEGSPP